MELELEHRKPENLTWESSDQSLGLGPSARLPCEGPCEGSWLSWAELEKNGLGVPSLALLKRVFSVVRSRSPPLPSLHTGCERKFQKRST